MKSGRHLIKKKNRRRMGVGQGWRNKKDCQEKTIKQNQSNRIRQNAGLRYLVRCVVQWMENNHHRTTYPKKG